MKKVFRVGYTSLESGRAVMTDERFDKRFVIRSFEDFDRALAWVHALNERDSERLGVTFRLIRERPR